MKGMPCLYIQLVLWITSYATAFQMSSTQIHLSLHKSTLSRDEANTYCIGTGHTLANLKGLGDPFISYLRRNYPDFVGPRMLIGYNEASGWPDGTGLNSTMWTTDFNDVNDCVQMIISESSSELWDDLCINPYPFLCSREKACTFTQSGPYCPCSPAYVTTTSNHTDCSDLCLTIDAGFECLSASYSVVTGECRLYDDRTDCSSVLETSRKWTFMKKSCLQAGQFVYNPTTEINAIALSQTMESEIGCCGLCLETRDCNAVIVHPGMETGFVGGCRLVLIDVTAAQIDLSNGSKLYIKNT